MHLEEEKDDPPGMSALGEYFLQQHTQSDLEFMQSSDESDVSGASNWTKGRSRQRLKVPRTLKGNNFISKGVKARKTAPYRVSFQFD